MGPVLKTNDGGGDMKLSIEAAQFGITVAIWTALNIIIVKMGTIISILRDAP